MKRRIGKKGAPVPPDDFARQLIRRVEKAQARRQNWIPLWQECYDLTLPENAGFTITSTSFQKRRDRLFDATAADAVDQLAASLLGQLTPPWVNWFGFAPGANLTLDESTRASPILNHSTEILQEQIDRSNLAVELHQCFLDLAVGGTACLQIDETAPGSPVAFLCRAVPLADVILEETATGQLENVYRKRVVSGASIARLPVNLPDHILQNALSNHDNDFEIIEFSERVGDAFEVGAILFDRGQDASFLYRMTLPHSPFIAFRWMKIPGETYGRSPVMKTLPDIKTANKVVELILKNASIAVTGIWQAEDDGVLNPANIELVPGAIIPKAVGSAGLKPLEMPARFDVSQLVLNDLRARIRHAMLVDRLAQIQSGRMTATEVLERSSEMGLLLGATYGRLQTELLNPLLTKLYGILRRRGDISDLPLDGRIVTIVHRSPLARAQAQAGVQPILTLIEAAARMGPAATLALDAPKMMKEIAETLGVPEHLLNVSNTSL